MLNTNAVIEATRLLRNNPRLARRLFDMQQAAINAPVHDVEVIEGIPTWNDAQVVADDFISEGAQISILTDEDGSYKVFADFSQSSKGK